MSTNELMAQFGTNVASHAATNVNETQHREKPDMSKTGNSYTDQSDFIERNLFDINDFISDVSANSRKKNQNMHRASNNINSYDIAQNCIRQTVFRILNYPVEDYKDVWLPVIMRAFLGNAVHNFIQDNYRSFTEQEMSVKVPSIRASSRMDSMIGPHVLCEIKSCTYADYEKILKQSKPRDSDFFQTIFYKYLLENHLDEAKQQTNTRTPPPMLDKYDIRYIQFIYAAHDIMTSDCGSYGECLKTAKRVKQMLNSRVNQFHYITAITIDLNSIDITPHMEYVVGKLNSINYYLNNNIIPPMNDPYVSDSCFFCLYKRVCAQNGGPSR